MKKTIGLLVSLVLLLPALASSGALSFRLGYFVPRAQSDLWTIEFQNMSFQKSDFQTATLGIHYEQFLTKELSILVGFESFSRTQLGYYRDYVGYSFEEGDFAFPADIYEGDFDISHNFSVSSTPIQLSLKLTPLGRRSSFIPYIGGGIALYVWSVKLLGDMVDFTDEWFYDDPDLGEITIYGIYTAEARAESRFSFGFQGFAGFMIPVASRLAIEAEFKYSQCRGDLGDAFPDFEDFDLGGYQFSVGINYWF